MTKAANGRLPSFALAYTHCAGYSSESLIDRTQFVLKYRCSNQSNNCSGFFVHALISAAFICSNVSADECKRCWETYSDTLCTYCRLTEKYIIDILRETNSENIHTCGSSRGEKISKIAYFPACYANEVLQKFYILCRSSREVEVTSREFRVLI